MATRALVCLCLLAACSPPAPTPLPESTAFAGELALVLPHGERIAGRVAFDRTTGALQFTWVQGSDVRTLQRGGDGVLVFAGDRFRAADASETEVLTRVEQAIAPGPFRAVGPGVYVRTLADGELRVEAHAAAAPHGRR